MEHNSSGTDSVWLILMTMPDWGTLIETAHGIVSSGYLA